MEHIWPLPCVKSHLLWPAMPGLFPVSLVSRHLGLCALPIFPEYIKGMSLLEKSLNYAAGVGGLFKAPTLQGKAVLLLWCGEKGWLGHLWHCLSQPSPTLKGESSTSIHNLHPLQGASAEGNILCLCSLIHNYPALKEF